MDFFLDTANVEEARHWTSLGFIKGITTNPTLLSHEVKKTSRPFQDILKDLCSLVEGPVSAEVISYDEAGMLKEADLLRAISPNIIIKVPLTPIGLKVCVKLILDDALVNVTLCFSPAQALLAAKAGATFVSPFIGRLEDHGGCGTRLISDIRSIFDHDEQIETAILAASIRSVSHVVQAAQSGANIVTLPPKLMEKLFFHPLTKAGLESFESDWGKQL